MYNMTAFILRKDLHASAFALAILTMLRPTVALFSYYWSSLTANKRKNLKNSYLWATFFGCLPSFFVHLFPTIGFVILAATLYILFYRAMMPAWMEVIKLNIIEKKRDSIFAWTSTIGYLVGILLAVFFGRILEGDGNAWKNLFIISAGFSILNLLVLSRVPVNNEILHAADDEKAENKKLTLKETLIAPWKDSLMLVRTKPDFGRFQLGFLISGIGLMIIQPILPIFCADVLNLSHAEFAAAALIYRNLGYVVSSPIWAKGLRFISVKKLSAMIFLMTGLFIFLLVMSPVNVMWLYLAYGLYGIAQGGSHLIWNLSGPIFADKEDNSAKYSSVNVVMVAARGSFAPLLGGFLTSIISLPSILVLGGLLCISSCFPVLKRKKQPEVS